MHYNGFTTAEINGGPAAGVSTGQAQAAIEKILAERCQMVWPTSGLSWPISKS